MNKYVGFFLMNKRGLNVLQSFINEFGLDNIKFVISSRDNEMKNDYYNEIKYICGINNIKFYDRTSFVDTEDVDIKYAIGWRWLIKNTENLIVLHDSILPKYRGFSPLVNSLINGEEEIGVSALIASSKYDEGDIIGQYKVKIKYPIKISDAIEIISNVYCKLINEIFYKLVNNIEIEFLKQNNREASYSLWRDYNDYFIDWNDTSLKIKRSIDALGEPFTGAKCRLNNDIIVIKEADVLADVNIENRDVGKVIFINEGKPVIVCGEGLIKLNEAYSLENNESIIPLKNFRVRFK